MKRKDLHDHSVLSSSTGSLKATSFDNNDCDANINKSKINVKTSTIRKANITSCYITLISTIIGAGILGMPYGISTMGWVLGLSLLTLCGISSGLALYYLTACSAIMKSPVTFHQIAEMTIPGYSWIIDAAIAIKCFGVGISYMIIIGDLIPIVIHTLQLDSMYQSRHLWITIAFLSITPIVYFEHMDSLKYTSFISLIFISILVMVVILYSIPSFGYDPCEDKKENICYQPTQYYMDMNMNTFTALPIFIFAYTCHQNTFAMVNEMVAPTQTKFNTVILSCISTAWILYVIVAICGYITYGAANTSDLLQNYPETALTTIARLCVSFIVLSHYPLQTHPLRQSLLSLWNHLSPITIDTSIHTCPDLTSIFTYTCTCTRHLSCHSIGRLNRFTGHYFSSSPSLISSIKVTPKYSYTSTLLDSSPLLTPSDRYNNTTATPAITCTTTTSTTTIAPVVRSYQILPDEETRLIATSTSTTTTTIGHNIQTTIRVPHNVNRKDRGENEDIQDDNENDDDDDEKVIKIIQLKRQMILTTGILISSYTVAMTVHNLGFMISIVGATGSVIISYILPGWCYYTLITDGPSYLRIMALGQSLLGVLLIPLCTTIIILKHSSH